MAKRKNRTRRRRSRWQGTLRMGLVFAALIGANVYFFVLRPRTSLPDVMKESQGLAPAAIAPAPSAVAAPRVKPAAPDDVEDARLVDGALEPGETLERALKREGLSPRTAAEVALALGKLLDPASARAGDYTLRFDAEDHLRTLDYRARSALLYHVEREGAAGFRAARLDRSVDTRVVEVGGFVGTSLYDGVKRAGELPSLVGALADLFAAELNLYVDAQPGDRFKLIVEKRFAGGKLYQYGRVLAAEYKGRAGTFRAFWFQGAYYTEHGESVARTLVKSPLKYARVPAGFDRHRFHPVPVVEHGHSGLDFGAPPGTPVWAAASGKVTAIGPRAGAGNLVSIAHANGLESGYLHLGRFARGLAVGQTVRQKQVIGYVGASGLASGPRVHFSLKQNGALIDPRTFKPQREPGIAAERRLELADVIAPRLAELAAIEIARAP